MSIRRPILFPALCLALAVFCAATAQPLQPEGDNEFGGTPGMHLFLQSGFIRTHQADRLHFARMRHYREGYLDAVGHGEYARALSFSDSLIRTAERHPMAGVHFTDCYKERAGMFRKLHRDSEACMAYARAVKVQDSLLRLEQGEVIREKQESYELDRMALDAALLTAHHHKTTLVYVSLALLVIAAVVGAIYVGNRRTRRLQKELLLQMKHAHESGLKRPHLSTPSATKCVRPSTVSWGSPSCSAPRRSPRNPASNTAKSSGTTAASCVSCSTTCSKWPTSKTCTHRCRASIRTSVPYAMRNCGS